MISEFKSILDSFNSIRLEEMDNVRLMDRIDTKYLLPANRIPDLAGIPGSGNQQIQDLIIYNNLSGYSGFHFFQTACYR